MERIWILSGLNSAMVKIYLAHPDFESLNKEDKKDFRRRANHSTMGWYATEEDAVTAVLENHCDLYECSNTYAVVYPLSPGVYAHVEPEDERWFKWDPELERYNEIDRIEHKHVIFTI